MMGLSWGRIRQVMVKEFLQVFRDPRMRFVLFVPPVIQLVVFGYAANFDVKHIRMAVFDDDRTSESRELVSRFEASPYFDVRRRAASAAEIREWIDREDVVAALWIEHGFARDIDRHRPAAVQIVVDGTDSNTAQILLGYANAVFGAYGEGLLAARIAGTPLAGRLPTVELEHRAWFNTNLESRNYFVPGVIASLLMLVTTLLTAMAIVREREIGTLEQLMVSPLKPAELILGKIIPFAAIGMADVPLIAGIGVFWFDVPMVGNPLILLFGALLFLLSALGIGLLISTLSQTQQQAMMLSFFVFIPALILSGFTFPIPNMPRLFQYLTYINPLRYFLVVIRGVFLRGAGLSLLWPQLAAMALLGVATMGISSMRFKKRLE